MVGEKRSLEEAGLAEPDAESESSGSVSQESETAEQATTEDGDENEEKKPQKKKPKTASNKYEEMLLADLRKLVRSRGYDNTGTKVVLAARLMKADAEEADGTAQKKREEQEKLNASIPDDPYAGIFVPELRNMLKSRGLNTNGVRSELIARLTASDQEKANDPSDSAEKTSSSSSSSSLSSSSSDQSASSQEASETASRAGPRKKTATTAPAATPASSGSSSSSSSSSSGTEDDEVEDWSKYNGEHVDVVGEIATEKKHDFSQPPQPEGSLKIVSWNVAGMKSIIGKGFDSYLADEKPDIICLQETKIDGKNVAPSVAKGYSHRYFNVCKTPSAGYSGTAILSKIKPISVLYGINAKEHDQEGRVITAEFDTFYLINSYIPNAGRDLKRLAYRMSWDQAMFNFLRGLDSAKPIIWCGDLNVAHKPIDLRNPTTNKKTAGFSIEERQSFSSFLKSGSGFVDVFRNFFPKQKGVYTFWSFMSNARASNTGWRLDYFVVSKRFASHVLNCFPRRYVMGSDHCPLVILLNPAPPSSA